jgi:hypothetical protein
MIAALKEIDPELEEQDIGDIFWQEFFLGAQNNTWEDHYKRHFAAAEKLAYSKMVKRRAENQKKRPGYGQQSYPDCFPADDQVFTELGITINELEGFIYDGMTNQ